MAICETCGRSMPTALSCTRDKITFADGATFARLPYMSEDGREQCPDCGVWPGGFHHISRDGHGCDVEVCPRCGKQMLMCVSLGTCDRSVLFPAK